MSVRNHSARSMRIVVYTDYTYHRIGNGVYSERAFTLFVAKLGSYFEKLTVIGRLAPTSSGAHYDLGEEVDFVSLPYYPSLTDPVPALRGMARSLGTFWRVLGRADCVWLLGPHPLVFVYAAMARLRRKKVVLGVREDLPEYVRMRHPGRRSLHLIADAMASAFRMIGRRCGVIAVGPAIADKYRDSRRLLEITVSLVEESDIVEPDAHPLPSDDGRLTVLSVGRLEAEKNPLLLADVLARLTADDPRWHLIVCGEGSMSDQLRARLGDLGVAEYAELRGYVPLREGLGPLYRDSAMFLHISWTEGLPQVLFEAFAAALPVVATDVGGIAEAAGDAVSLVPPGDPDAAAAALRELRDHNALRRTRIVAGNALARRTTIESECSRVADFIAGA